MMWDDSADRAYLRENDDKRTGLLEIDHELAAVVVGRPGHIERGPLLGDGPFWAEEPSSVKMLILLEQVAVRYPKDLTGSAPSD